MKFKIQYPEIKFHWVIATLIDLHTNCLQQLTCNNDRID